MLIVGPRCALDAFLAAARPDMAPPVRLVRPSDEIPPDCCGTLVLCDARALDERQRDGLLKWLCADSVRTQVISLSETHLWHRDRSPVIPLELYYRLNTICLEINDR